MDSLRKGGLEKLAFLLLLLDMELQVSLAAFI